MKKQTFKWFGVMLSLAMLFLMGGCGGGGGGATQQPVKAAIKGEVSFPSTTLSLNALVAKRAGKIVTDTNVSVRVYDLEGNAVGTAGNPEYDNVATEDKRVYSYSFVGLEPGKDYVIKAKRGDVVLKKLIEKKNVIGEVTGQSINSISTSAVIVASNTLGAVLGDVLPSGKTATDLSLKISTEIKPTLLEGTINAVVSGGRAGVIDANMAAFANVYNIVVTAGSEGKDPAAMFTTTPPQLTNTVPILAVAAGTSTVTVTPTVVNATNISAAATPTYNAPTESAATYTALAKSYLAKQDISNASLNYEKALTIDPNDAEANFGGAITSGMMLMEDADVQTIITKWGAVVPTVNQVVQGTSPVKLPFGNLTSIKLTNKTVAKSAGFATATQNILTAFSALKVKLPQQKRGFKSLAKELGLVPATAPTVGEMQTLIVNVIIPKIEKVIARLAKAETAGFSFTVTKAMQGNPINGKDVTLDAGEFYTLDAALNIFQVLFKIVGSYNFDVPAGFTYDTIGQDPLAMINSSTFFTLKSFGKAQMASALINAQTAAAKAALAFNVVKNRAVGAGTFDLSGWSELEKSDFTMNLGKVTAALAGPYDLVTNSKTIKIDATKFFTNPLTKANLPTFEYDVPIDSALSVKYHDTVATEVYVKQYAGYDPTTYASIYVDVLRPVYSNIVPTSDISNYTLNGILPDNTVTNNIANFNGILPKLDGKIITAPGLDSLKVLYGTASTGQPISYDSLTPNFYVSYNTPATATTTANTAVYKLDQSSGVIATYCSSVTGIPNGYTYQGLRYYSVPENMYARVLKNRTISSPTISTEDYVYEYRPMTVNANQSCTVSSAVAKTISIPYGKTWTMAFVGSGVEESIFYYTTTPSYTLYSSVDPATALLTLVSSYDSNKYLGSIRNETITVLDRYNSDLEQYTISADGKSALLTGTFSNIDVNGVGISGTAKRLMTSGGYYWLFDGPKLLKYAAHPGGGHL